MRRGFALVLALAVSVATGSSSLSQPGRAAFTSNVSALRITPVSALPSGPAQPLDDYCTTKVVTPRSAAARAVAGRGWHVTGEAPLGRLTAVSFVGRLEPATSGICLVDGGNVGFFAGQRLLAIVHAPRVDAATVRRITRTNTPGRLRIWSEEYSAPLADLVTRGDGAAVVPVAAADPACGGSVSVPNVYGRTIENGRRSILAVGWRPAPPRAADIAASTGGRDFDLRRAGITEVEVCSGTGLGLCLFNYRHRRGARLQVQTAGEGREIVDYRVECGGYRR